MVDRPFPGGEGKQEWGLKGSKAHLWVLVIEARVVGDGVSTVSGGCGARSTAAGQLQWGSGEEKRSRSGARTRQSCRWGL